MIENSRLKRRKNIKFAIGMASIDGGCPSSFTKELLVQYENDSITSTKLKRLL